MTVKAKKRKMPSVDLEVVTPVATKLSKPQSPTTTAVDSGNQCVWSPAYGGEPSIDTYTINYIHRIYCRECRMEELRRKKDQEGNRDQPISPPMEDKSLQQAMDKNKESLKRRLMLRRSVNELVDQGIYPPLKTPPGYAEQRRQLERAKTGDLLRHKLEHRPDRQSLVQHHILEDTNVDPSLQDRQRQLKKAKLQDSLSERLLNRPGPLELVEGNILQIDPQLKDAIKEGKLHFTKTTEVDVPQRRHFRFNAEDGSSSEGAPSPESSNDLSATTPSPTSVAGIPPAPDIGPLLQKIQQSAVIQGQQFTLTPTTALGSQMLTAVPVAVTPPPPSATAVIKPGVVLTTQNGNSSSIKKNRVQKAKPNKATPKSKVIKFHEYKGPPNLVKVTTPTSMTTPSTTTSPTPPPPPPACPSLPVPTMLPSPGGVDTPYNIMLKQQQLYLQWQLEFQQKKLPFILTPAQDPKSVDSSPSSSQSATAASTPVPPPPAPPPPPVRANTPTRVRTATPSPAATSTALAVVSPVITPGLPLTTTSITATTPATAQTRQQDSTTKVTKLEDLKVADLKAELKRRNLPVSGTKPQLIERLNQHAESIIGSFATTASSTSASSVSDTYTSPRSVQSLASPSSVGSLGGIVNIQPVTPVNPTEETSNFAMDITPVSPSSSVTDLHTSISSHLSQPMSPPENPMDMAVPSPPSFSIGTQAIVKAYLSSSQSIVPMAVDQHLSRPPSVAPMDVDLNGSQTSLHMIGMDQNQNPQVIAHSQPSNQYLTQASPAHVSNTYTQVPKPHTPVSSRTPTPHATSLQQSPSPHTVTPISQPATPHSLIQLQQPTTPQTNQLHQVPAPQSQTPTPQIPAQLGTPTSVARVQTPTASPAPPAASPQPQPIVIQPQTQELPVQTPQQLRFTANQQLLQQMQEKLNFQAAAVQLRQQQQQQVGQPQVITHEQLVRQQQRQIEELQRQLQQSQVRLTEAENQAKQHQTALQRHLAQLQQLHTAQQQQQQQLQNAQQQVLASQQAVGTADATAVAPDTSVLATQSEGGQRRENRVPPQQPVFQIVPMHQSQQQQTIPSITLTNSTQPVTKVEKRETKPSCLQQTNLQRGGQLQQPRLLQLATLQQPNGQQLLITAQPNPVQVQPANTSQNKTVTSLNNHVNGVSSTSKASSVPTSPVGGSKLHRSATSPFFTNMTLREPPKYDEAIKNKQNVLMQQTVADMLSSTPALNSAINNCQAMDDVLEILIRSGELPASAAQEPPPTPKTCTVTSSQPSSTATQPVVSTILIPASSATLPTGSTITIPAVSLGTSPITIPGYSLAGSTFSIPASSLSGPGFTIPASIAGSAFTIPPSSTTLLTTKDIPVPVSSMLASVPQAVTTTTSTVTPVSSPAIVNTSQTTRVPNAYTTTTSPSNSIIKKEPPTPLSVDISVSNSTDLVASLTEHLPSSFTDLPFMTMDWSDSDIPDSLLDTPNPDSVHSDSSSRFTDQSIGSHDLLSVSCSGNVLGQIENGSIHGSEPHLNSLGVGEAGDPVTDVTNAMNVDVSDWLDVIMPSTGLTPLSSSASVSFPVSDPILTPKTQDVLADLFNMDDTDLCTPADLGINFEQAMEASSSKS